MGAFLGYPAVPAAAPGLAGPPTVQVTGVGEASAAYEQTAAALNRVVQTLMQAGLTAADLQTQQVSLSPVYPRTQEEGESRPTGYEASATLAVTLRDLARVGAVIDLAVAAGANRVDGVQFAVREAEQAEAVALAQAVQDAQRQAAVLARSAAEGLPLLPGRLTVARSVRVVYPILGPAAG